MPKSIKEQLYDLKKENNILGLIDLIYGVIKGYQDDPDIAAKQTEISEFWREITKKPLSADTENFIESIADTAISMYYDKAYAQGQKINEWKNRIKKGELPETELDNRDDDIVSKIAHDIVVLHENEDNLFENVFTNILQGLNKVREFKGKSFQDYIEDKEHEIQDKKCEQYGINLEELQEYRGGFKNQDTATTGYVVKKEKPAPGESYFQSLPDYVTELYKCVVPQDVDDYEETIYERADIYRRHEQMGASAAKMYRALYSKLKAFSDAEPEKSEAHIHTMKMLERATHLGKDYQLDDIDVNLDNVKKSNLYSYVNISNATLNIDLKLDEFSEELDNRIKQLEEAGDTESEEYNRAVDFSNALVDLYNLNNDIARENKEYGKLKINNTDEEKADETRSYVKAYREKAGFFQSSFRINDGFKKALNSLTDELSDSLVNNRIYSEEYEKFFSLVNKHIRLHEKLENCKDGANKANETAREAEERISENYEESKKALAEQIKLIREFEKKNPGKDPILGHNIDRNAILTTMEKVMENKPNLLDVDKITSTWNVQDNPLDKLWFGMNYYFMTLNKGEGLTLDVSEREKYGFNIDGGIDQQERDIRKQMVEDNILKYTENDTLDEFKMMGEYLGRLNIKTLVVTGKDYNTIYNSLKGQENAELKARYLHNESGNGIMMESVIEFMSYYESKLESLIKDNTLLNGIYDPADKTITLDKLFDKIGITNEEREKFYSKNLPEYRTSTIHDLFSFGEEAVDMEQFGPFLSKTLKTIFIQRGYDKENSIISLTEKKYADMASKNLDSPNDKREVLYADIKDWKEAEGKKIAENLYKTRLVLNLQKSSALLQCKKRMGVEPGLEIGRFYNNSLKEEDTYITEIVKDKKNYKEVCDKIAAEKKYEKLANRSTRSVPVGYDAYIERHTAERGGDTPEKMVENLSKVLAAYSLQKLGKKFDVKTIRKISEHIRKTYKLDELAANPKELRECLRDKKYVLKMGEKKRAEVYGVESRNLKAYFKCLASLKKYMMSRKGRSEKYQEFYDSIDAAAGLKDSKLSPEELQIEVGKANLRIVEAVRNYVSGKEKVRSTQNGKDSFDNALDALSIVTQFAPATDSFKDDIISNINRVRNRNNKDAENYIYPEYLRENYGVKHAKELYEDRLLRTVKNPNTTIKASDPAKDITRVGGPKI